MIDRWRRPVSRQKTSGFTLLELLLVVSVLAVLASLTLPQIAWLLGDRKVVRSANQVREEFMRARINAMREGRVMMMDAILESNQLRVRPYFSAADSVNALDQTGTQSALLNGADQGNVTAVIADEADTQTVELAGEVIVQAVSVVSAARAAEIEQMNMSQQSSGYSQPILFYPDGTTSTAAVTVSDAKYGKVTIKMRGITGEVTVGSMEPNE